MEKIYGLQTVNENLNVIINGDEALLTIQTPESFETLELNLQFDNKDAGITKDGAKTSSVNKENQPYPVQRALKRIEELNYITDVRIDEEFETTVDGFPENRLTITIDYLDVDFVKEMKKGD